jgi:CheY-like chemotaxis protein
MTAGEGSRVIKSILVVDSEPVCQSFIMHALHAQGCRVVQARTGSEALAICKNPPHPIDLVMIDAFLPDALGIEIAAQMRQHCPAVPILLMSGTPLEGLSEIGTAQWATLAGPSDFLPKPFPAVALYAKIGKLMPGRCCCGLKLS